MLVKNTLVALIAVAPVLALPVVTTGTTQKATTAPATVKATTNAAVSKVASLKKEISQDDARIKADRAALRKDEQALMKDERLASKATGKLASKLKTGKLAEGAAKLGKLAKEGKLERGSRNHHNLRIKTSGLHGHSGRLSSLGRIGGVRSPLTGKLSGGLRTPGSGRLSAGLRTPGSGKLSGLHSGRLSGLHSGKLSGGLRSGKLSGGLRTPGSGMSRLSGLRSPLSGRLSAGPHTPLRTGGSHKLSGGQSPFSAGRNSLSNGSPFSSGFPQSNWASSPWSMGGFSSPYGGYGGYGGMLPPGRKESIKWTPGANGAFTEDISYSRLARRALPASPAADPAMTTGPLSPGASVHRHRSHKSAFPTVHSAGEAMAVKAMLLEAEHIVNSAERLLGQAPTAFSNSQRNKKLQKLLKLAGPKASSTTPSTPTTPRTPTTPLSPKAN